MKKKYIKRIIIILVILIIILYLAINLIKKQDYRAEFNKKELEVYAEMQKEMYMPNGMFLLKQNYIGNQDLKEFYINLKEVYEELIKISKVDENKIENYYQKESARLKNLLGISNLEDFEKFANYSKKHGKLEKFLSADIDTESFKKLSNYLKFEITFKFDENKELKYEVKLMNNSSNGLARYKEIQ